MGKKNESGIKYMAHFFIAFFKMFCSSIFSELARGTHVGIKVKCPLFLSDFNQNWSISTIFLE